jgi:hypothetical protein
MSWTTLDLQNIPKKGDTIWARPLGRGKVEDARLISHSDIPDLAEDDTGTIVFEKKEGNENLWRGGGKWGDCVVLLKACFPWLSEDVVNVLIMDEWTDTITIMPEDVSSGGDEFGMFDVLFTDGEPLPV